MSTKKEKPQQFRKDISKGP